jgi:hypothetical protein
MAETIARRKLGRCKDCGREMPVRTVTFWVNGMPYVVCADCEKAYRPVILWPVTIEQQNKSLEAWREHYSRHGKPAK